jgi:hypothetical protein
VAQDKDSIKLITVGITFGMNSQLVTGERAFALGSTRVIVRAPAPNQSMAKVTWKKVSRATAGVPNNISGRQRR